MSSFAMCRPYVLFLSIALVLSLALGMGLRFVAELDLVVSYLVAVNTVAVFMMGLDKGFARGGSYRVPEATLLVLGVGGAVPGILLATRMFRHKTRKARFQLCLLLIAVVQLLIWQLLLN